MSVQLGILKINIKLSKQENNAGWGTSFGDTSTPAGTPISQKLTAISPRLAGLEGIFLRPSLCCLHEFLAAKFVL